MNEATRKGRALGTAIVSLWYAADAFGDFTNDADTAMRMLTEHLRDVDLRDVDGVLASPLNYWARAYLDDENPEDLTYDEMLESIKISLSR